MRDAVERAAESSYTTSWRQRHFDDLDAYRDFIRLRAVADAGCMRQFNQSPRCLSCRSLKRLREEGPMPFTGTEL